MDIREFKTSEEEGEEVLKIEYISQFNHLIASIPLDIIKEWGRIYSEDLYSLSMSPEAFMVEDSTHTENVFNLSFFAEDLSDDDIRAIIYYVDHQELKSVTYTQAD